MSTPLARYVAARKVNPFGQFGQSGDYSTFGGATACGHTSVQTLLRAFKGIRPSQDTLSRIAGYWRPASRIGTSGPQLAKMANHFGLKLVYKSGMTRAEIENIVKTRGPVILSVRYPRYPNWRGYGGTSRPSPYSQPFGHSGRNQFSGNFTHWVVYAGKDTVTYPTRTRVVMEPNHHSPARPERVVVDHVAGDAFWAAVYAAFGSGNIQAVIPAQPL